MITDIETFIDGAIAYQYKASPNFKGFIQGLGLDAQHLADEIEKVKWERFLDKAKGVQLDILGDILGIRREVVDLNELVYFGFEPDPTALSFTSLDNPKLGGRYRAADEAPNQFRLLNDTEYRAVLQAKIAINASNCTIPEVIKVARGLFLALIPNGDTIPLSVSENYDAKFILHVGADIDDWIKALILNQDLIPRPAGVGVTLDYLIPNRTLTIGNDGAINHYGYILGSYGALDVDAVMQYRINRFNINAGGAFFIGVNSNIANNVKIANIESIVCSIQGLPVPLVLNWLEDVEGTPLYGEGSRPDIWDHFAANDGNDISFTIGRLDLFVPDRKLQVGYDGATYGYWMGTGIGGLSNYFLNGRKLIRFHIYSGGTFMLNAEYSKKFYDYNEIEIEFVDSGLPNVIAVWEATNPGIYSEINRTDVLEYFKANVGKQIDFKIVDRRV